MQNEEYLKKVMGESTFNRYLHIKKNKGQKKANEFAQRILNGENLYIPKDTLTPPLPVENSKIEEGVPKHLSVDDIFNKAMSENIKSPQEDLPTQMVGGGVGYNFDEIPMQTQIYKIQNFRRYFNFDKSTFKPFKPSLPRPSLTSISTGEFKWFDWLSHLEFSWDYEIKNSNYGVEWHFFDFFGCNIKVKKNKIEVLNKVLENTAGKGEIIVRGWTLDEIDQNLNQINLEMENHCIRALRYFIDIHGGSSDFQIVPTAKGYEGEHNQIGGVFLEGIKPLRFHTPEGKKVYNEPKFEHYKKATAINGMRNIALHDFAPEIANQLDSQNQEIREIRAVIKELADADKYLAENWNAHIPAIIKIGESAQSQAESSRKLAEEVQKLAGSVDAIRIDKIKRKKYQNSWYNSLG